MTKDTLEMIQRLNTLGFNNDEAFTLRRIAMTFHSWDEGECGNGNDYASWSIERDDETNIPYRCTYFHDRVEAVRTRIPDREAGAQKRLDKIMSQHPDFVAYHQGDCRGASLYIVRKSDLNGSDIHSTYIRGTAVYA